VEEPKSLDSLFKEKLFRIPDYQRGYAWQPEQLKDFWEDLMNLSDGRRHYTGVLTLKQIPSGDVKETDKEYFLVEDHSYNLYHIVDGQQRLTTFVIFLQAFIEFVRALPENSGRLDAEIFISESLSLADVQSRFLYKVKPRGLQYRAYKFGYTVDNPSYEYLRYRIFDEEGGGSVQETFYTLNLNNAKQYFSAQFRDLHLQQGFAGLEEVYKKLTKRFLFNEYIIKDEFDVFVAFETMNNRGKSLSNLELLKNRLIYLTTLYDDYELGPDGRSSLRESINAAWKEVYYQLGRNKAAPLNDDEFLRAHWMMHFWYWKQAGWTHVNFLLNEHFTPQRVHEKVESEVALEVPEERLAEADIDGPDDDEEDAAEETIAVPTAKLQPQEISDYVNSMKESGVHWFNTFYPYMADGMADEERHWIERLNRIGIPAHFRPLVAVILKNERNALERIEVFRQIERFIFIALRMTWRTSNYGASEFYRVTSDLNHGRISLKDLAQRLDARLSFVLNEDGSLRSDYFQNILHAKFEAGSGYYSWSGLRYFLYEYELGLQSQSRQTKVEWDDLTRSEGDRISIEHVYPQTETEEWTQAFSSVEPERRRYYNASLGNLLLLSGSINSSLQNDSFADKKKPKYNPQGIKIRNGYSDGSHSEIEVSQLEKWGPDEIRERGLKLLRFMERRWNFAFQSDDDRERLLFLRPDEKHDHRT
jgi:hypothetical protein